MYELNVQIFIVVPHKKRTIFKKYFCNFVASVPKEVKPFKTFMITKIHTSPKAENLQKFNYTPTYSQLPKLTSWKAYKSHIILKSL